MAEETWMQTLIDSAAKNTAIKAQVGVNVWQGQSNISKDLTPLCPFLDFTRMPWGRDILSYYMGEGLVKMETWHASSVAKAQKSYQVAYEELTNAHIKGATYDLAIYEFQAPEDSPGWENKCFRSSGLLKVVWVKR